MCSLAVFDVLFSADHKCLSSQVLVLVSKNSTFIDLTSIGLVPRKSAPAVIPIVYIRENHGTLARTLGGFS
jgi:hypothetical protein